MYNINVIASWLKCYQVQSMSVSRNGIDKQGTAVQVQGYDVTPYTRRLAYVTVFVVNIDFL